MHRLSTNDNQSRTFLTPRSVQTDKDVFPFAGISLPSPGSRADMETICLPGVNPKNVCRGSFPGYNVGTGGLCSILFKKRQRVRKDGINSAKAQLTHPCDHSQCLKWDIHPSYRRCQPLVVPGEVGYDTSRCRSQ